MTGTGLEKAIVRADAAGAVTHDFTVTHSGGTVPGAVWFPAHGSPKGLILYGHGGSRHKRDASVITFVEAAVAWRFAVAAIDGPVHGARYDGPPRSGPDTQMAFRKLWEADDGSAVAGMVADWRATLDALLLDPLLRGVKTVYYGLSMGHAFGVPLLAEDDRIDAAVIGLWGVNYPNSERLATAAGKVRCPTLTIHMRTDEFFTLDGGVALFDALPGEDKRFLLLPGPHALVPEQAETGLAFLAKRLGIDLA